MATRQQRRLRARRKALESERQMRKLPDALPITPKGRIKTEGKSSVRFIHNQDFDQETILMHVPGQPWPNRRGKVGPGGEKYRKTWIRKDNV